MKDMKIDENAHATLIEAKERMKKEGIENPSFSDAIRWMWQKIQEGK